MSRTTYRSHRTVLADARTSRPTVRSASSSSRPSADVVRVGAEAETVRCQCTFSPWWLALSVTVTVASAVLLEFGVMPALRKAFA